MYVRVTSKIEKYLKFFVSKKSFQALFHKVFISLVDTFKKKPFTL
jgi:hypothetical protein